MKFNKWTLGLAAVGAVSLTSAVTARADGAGNLNSVQAAFAGITISGAVDTSIDVALSPTGNDFGGSPISGVPFHGVNKQDGFNLNVVELNIEKPLDESEWASGFKMQLIFGPDAVDWNPSMNSHDHDDVFGDTTSGADFAIKQAYVNLRTPVGNGIEWKIGVFDTIIGYEVFESWKNPNFTRSWGYWLEPTQHEGVLASYKFNDIISASLGVANTLSTGIGNRNSNGDFGDKFWCKTWMGSITLTAPQSMGFLAGSALYVGVVDGFAGDLGGGESAHLNLYAGAVINTPVTGLTTGIAFDYVDFDDLNTDVEYNVGLYASYKATPKLSFHGRAEYGWWEEDFGGGADFNGCWWGLTGTVQYDLWANVISRLELRYEHDSNSGFVRECGAGLYANITYVF